MYGHVCVCVRVMRADMPVSMCGKDRGGRYVILEMRSHPELNSLFLGPGSTCVCPRPQHWGYRLIESFLPFYMGPGI